MSNLEPRPHETLCGGRATATLEPTYRVLEPREVPLGGPRAMLVRRTLPHRQLTTVGAWCFLDEYGPADVAGGVGMQVPPHPHIGLQTVTWLLAGEVLHQDSLGSEQLVRPGELNLMTAGNGIAHAETSPPNHSDVLRGVQLWVALPDQHRRVDPHFEHHPQLPAIEDGDLHGVVIMGSVAGAVSTACAYSPLVGADLELAADASTRLPLETEFEHAVLAISPGLVVDGVSLGAGELIYLGCGRRDVAFSAGALGARLLLLGGVPIEEELLMWWNFVGRSHEEIVQARADWEESVRDGAGRFGPVPRYDGAALTAPALPSVRLKPRSRA